MIRGFEDWQVNENEWVKTRDTGHWGHVNRMGKCQRENAKGKMCLFWSVTNPRTSRSTAQCPPNTFLPNLSIAIGCYGFICWWFCPSSFFYSNSNPGLILIPIQNKHNFPPLLLTLETCKPKPKVYYWLSNANATTNCCRRPHEYANVSLL
jgi:hypothetical protein